jgi:membrane protease YdiL (CAAX protease family)
VACLVALGVVVGFGEELMFRGIGVIAFRRAGFSEGRVALWSSLVFGLVAAPARRSCCRCSPTASGTSA